MDSLAHLMTNRDSANRVEMVTDLCLDLVAREGWAAVTPRAVADLCGVSRQAVHQWCGGQDELRRLVARCFAKRWERWVTARLRLNGLPGLLAHSHEEVVWCRVWLAISETACRDEGLARLVEGVNGEERLAIRAALLGDTRDCDDLRPHLVQAIVHGLRSQICLLDVKQADTGGAPRADVTRVT